MSKIEGINTRRNLVGRQDTLLTGEGGNITKPVTQTRAEEEVLIYPLTSDDIFVGGTEAQLTELGATPTTSPTITEYLIALTKRVKALEDKSK